jgi:hypothetical protein
MQGEARREQEMKGERGGCGVGPKAKSKKYKLTHFGVFFGRAAL